MADDIDFHKPFSRERLAGYSPDILDRNLLLLGAGALGAALANQFTMWGFMRATIVDFDTYEPSNLTRTLDFPHRRMRQGMACYKAEEVARHWRRRLREAGAPSDRIHSIIAYVQELAPMEWRNADMVIAAVDHPRARYDVATLARRYGKPLVIGGFDASSKSVTVHTLPSASDSPCYSCCRSVVPDYAASDVSCTAEGRRAHEARKIPATPTMAALTASLMVQQVVDSLSGDTASMDATTHRIDCAARTGIPLGTRSRITRVPQCPHHETVKPLPLHLSGERIDAVLHELERQFPNVTVPLSARFPVYIPDGSCVRRVALPPWRCPAKFAPDLFPETPPSRYPLALDEINLMVLTNHDLGALPPAYFGLQPGATFSLMHGERTPVHVTWTSAEASV